MATRRATISTASAAPLWVFAHRAIWLRLLPMRPTCRVRSRSTSAAGAVHVRVRAIARRISADSGTPAADALARQSADSVGVRRTATRTGRRLAIGMRRHGGNGGDAPARAIHRSAGLLGFEGAESLASPWVIPRVGWLSRRSGQTRPPTLGTLGRQNRHTRILRSPPYAVSTTGKEAMSQGFQRRTIGGKSPASGRPRADPGALSATHREADGDLGDRLVCPRPGTSPVVSLMHADVLVWLEDPGGSAAPPSIPDLWLRRNSPPRGPTRWISGGPGHPAPRSRL